MLTTLIALAISQPSAIEHRTALVTAYTPSIAGGGAGTGITSTGIRTDHRPYGIAADPRLIPYGSVIHVPGYRDTPEKGGPFWPVDDTGGAMRQSARRGILHLDVRMRHVASARAWGRRWVTVMIYTPEAQQ
jgi:3D (Asp-Asp-Asp) domain-containing protein